MIRAATVALLMTAGMVLAQPAATPAPATPAPSAPTSQAAVVPENQDSPRGTLKIFSSALQSGDKATVKKVLSSSNPTEEKFAIAMEDLSEATSNLSKASLKGLPADQAKRFATDPNAHDETMKLIDGSNEKITGDTAAVSVDASHPPLTRKKIDGKWMVPTSELIKGVDSSKLDEYVAQVTVQASVYNEVAKETESGKYKTGDEVLQAIQTKGMRAALQRAAAGSQPAQAPAAPVPAPAPAK